MFQVPKPIHIWILGGMEAVQTCAQKTFFRSLKKWFSAKPPFSSSYWGKQCFRSPSLSTYGFWVEWKQFKHARKKHFFGAWKNDFLQSLRFLQAIEENNVSDPQAYPHMDFGWNGSSPNMRAKNNFSEPEKMIFCKAQFHPVKQYKVPRQKKMNR